jgi:ethanolamine kinase
MYALVNKFSLCVRQFWGNWALVQAQVSTLDFDFLGFATLLLKEYETRKDEFLKL